MNQARISSVVGCALIALGSSAGCRSAGAGNGPSPALVRARTIHHEAQSTQAGELAPADLESGEQLLAGAEKQHEVRPGSNIEMHLANLATAKFRIAMADARRRQADRSYLMAELDRQQSGRDSGLEAEREARIRAEQQAQDAKDLLERQGKVAEGEASQPVVVAGELLFRSNESELMPNARDNLNTIARALVARGNDVTIEISGYADATGPSAVNQRLSLARAEAVKRYLIEQGVPADRIHTVGHGERDPVASNSTPEGRANNRRVEISIPGNA